MLKYQRIRGLAWRQIGQEAVIVDLKSNRAIGVNSTASTIWHQLTDEQSLTDLVATCEIPESESARVQHFLTQLVDLKLVVASGDDAVVHAFSDSDSTDWQGPTVLWTEQLEKFAGFCAKEPGNAPCGTDVSLS